MNEIVNTHTAFEPLMKTWVGKCYPPEFFDYITNKEARQLTQQVCEETTEDLETFISKIKSFGVEVEQPDIVLTSKDAKKILDSGKEIPRPPLSPRDNYIALGKVLYRFANDPSYDSLFEKYKKAGATVYDPYNNQDQRDLLSNEEYEKWWSVGKVSSDELTKKNIMHPYQKSDDDRKIRTHLYPAASINKCGKILNIESLPKTLIKWSEESWNNFSIHHASTNGGMKDGRFSTLKKGLILTLQDLPNYDTTYPNWDTIILPNQGNLAMKEQLPKLVGHSTNKGVYGNAWYETGDLNQDHVNYIDEWINYWSPFTKEHIVDVNAFSIDQSNVILNGYNERLYELLQTKYGITVYFVFLRNRYFWDGGHHCNTVDIVREDTNTDYITVDNKKDSTVIEIEIAKENRRL